MWNQMRLSKKQMAQKLKKQKNINTPVKTPESCSISRLKTFYVFTILRSCVDRSIITIMLVTK